VVVGEMKAGGEEPVVEEKFATTSRGTVVPLVDLTETERAEKLAEDKARKTDKRHRKEARAAQRRYARADAQRKSAAAPVSTLLVRHSSSTVPVSASRATTSGSCTACSPWPMRRAPPDAATRCDAGAAGSTPEDA
jgi:membrane protein involved in colicin uptake